MYRKVLLAYDGSVDGRLALCEGATLARLCRGDVFLLAVVNPSTSIIMAENAVPGAVQLLGSAYGKVLAEGVQRLQAMGFHPTARLEFGDPADQIAAVAARSAPTLLSSAIAIKARWHGGGAVRSASAYSRSFSAACSLRRRRSARCPHSKGPTSAARADEASCSPDAPR